MVNVLACHVLDFFQIVRSFRLVPPQLSRPASLVKRIFLGFQGRAYLSEIQILWYIALTQGTDVKRNKSYATAAKYLRKILRFGNRFLPQNSRNWWSGIFGTRAIGVYSQVFASQPNSQGQEGSLSCAPFEWQPKPFHKKLGAKFQSSALEYTVSEMG